MGEHYEHFSLEERCQIAQLRADGQSIQQIAAALDRPPSTLSRELTRNSGAQPSHLSVAGPHPECLGLCSKQRRYVDCPQQRVVVPQPAPRIEAGSRSADIRIPALWR